MGARTCHLVETALEVVGYSSQRFITGVNLMLDNKLSQKVQGRNTLKRRSGTLALALVSSVFISFPSAIADEAFDATAAAEMAAVAELNSLRYSIATKTKTIFVDLADIHVDEVAFIDVKMPVVINGKKVLRYFPVDTVILDDFGRAKIKTQINIKVGDLLRVSVLGYPKDVPIIYRTVK
jgi:hypothetical protein